MAQYISIFFDNEKRYYENSGLREIIEYIGKEEYKGKPSLSPNEAYKRGKKEINSRLKKWHMTAIERLVKAQECKFQYNYDQKGAKPVWKIHRSKAKKIFKVIYSIIKQYNNPDVRLLFNKICRDYGFDSGAEAAGNPYYKKIRNINQLKAEKYNAVDINDLIACAEKIEKFSKLH